MTSRVTPKRCTLGLALGRRELCPGGACVFWDADGSASETPCTIERLRIPLEIPELARHLLELRLEVEAARAEAERRDASRRLAELLNLNRE